jgi:nucleotide-binding universal stress UspA family protein
VHEVILVGVDGSVGGYAAVAEAAEIAKRFGAKLIALSVEEGLPKVPTLMDEVDEFIRKKDKYYEEVGRVAVRIAGEHGASLRHEIRIGGAADQIIRFAEEVKADLIVLGYKGHSRFTQLVIGTTAQKVNTYSKSSVLIVKPTAPSEAVWARIVSIDDDR